MSWESAPATCASGDPMAELATSSKWIMGESCSSVPGGRASNGRVGPEGSEPKSEFDAQDPQRIPEEHLFHFVSLQPGETGPFQHVNQLAHPVQAGRDGRKRIVGAEQDFVPNTVLLHQHERMVELEWPVMQRRAVGVHVRMLADSYHALAFVGMAQMRHDDLQVRVAGGDIV